MAKKSKLVLFIIAATAFNILTTVICFTFLMLLYSILAVSHIPEKIRFIGFPLLFLASIILSFLIYRVVLKLYLKKYPF